VWGLLSSQNRQVSVQEGKRENARKEGREKLAAGEVESGRREGAGMA